jgi:hypothetical protein
MRFVDLALSLHMRRFFLGSAAADLDRGCLCCDLFSFPGRGAFRGERGGEGEGEVEVQMEDVFDGCADSHGLFYVELSLSLSLEVLVYRDVPII